MSLLELAGGNGFRITISDIPDIVAEFFACVDVSDIDKRVRRFMASLREDPIFDVLLPGKRFVLGLEIALNIYLRRGSGDPDLSEFPDTMFF